MEFGESPSPEAQEDTNLSSSIARGGPLFVSNLVGPLTNVPIFESSLLRLLEELEVEVSSGPPDSYDIDISVEELKVLTEEELVDVAMKEAFQDEGADVDSSSHLGENWPNAGENPANNGDASTAPECRNASAAECALNYATGDHAKKRKRKTTNNPVSRVGASSAHVRSNGSVPEASPNDARGDSATKTKRKTHNNSASKEAASTIGPDFANGSAPEAISTTAIGDNTMKRKRKPKNDSASEVETSAAPECSNTATSEAISNTTTGNSVKRKKRKPKNIQALAVSYIAKVEEVVKIKQQQDEDKAAAAAGLHSLNAICKVNEGATSSRERAEKLKIMRSTGSSIKMKPSTIQENIPMCYPETVISVEVYHNTRKYNKTQEFLVLGQQALTELRDKIHCITDHIMAKAELYDPSGYFLIEDMFLNDLRDPSAIEYSEPILEWLRNSKEEALQKWECIVSGELQQKQIAVVGNARDLQLPQFKAVEMQKACLCDLKFQLGAGYLYCHQGDCKHTIVIRDMRLIHPEDIQNRAAYPIVTFQQKTRALKCCVCKIYRATKVTVDDKWAQENPCYFCDNCYFLLHYSKDQSLLYDDFSVFDYHPD